MCCTAKFLRDKFYFSDKEMTNSNSTNHIPGVEILELEEFRDWHKVPPFFDDYFISFFLPFPKQTPFQSGDDILDHALNGNIAALESVNKLVEYRDHHGHDLLTIAAYAGQLNLVKFLHQKGLPIEGTSPSGLTPLLSATVQGHLNTVCWLVENGASVNACLKDDGTAAIHLASYDGNQEILSYLLQNGAFVDSEDHEGRTALMVACQTRHRNIVELLLSYKPDTKKTAKCGKSAPVYAAVTGHHECLSLLLDADKSLFEKCDNNDCPILTVAALHGNKEVVELLIRSGADKNCQDKFGRTALMAAVESGNNDIVENLLDHGAVASSRSMSGISAFEIALVSDNSEIAEKLAGILNDDSKDHMGNTPLILACRYSKIHLVQLIMQTISKDNINHQNHLGMSPLLACCMCDNCDLTEYLLNNGADIEMTTKNNLNAYQIAYLNRSHGVVKLLEGHFTATLLRNLLNGIVVPSCALGETEMLKELHQKGCDIKRASSSGIRPLMMASFHGNKEMVKYLIQNDAVIDGRNRHGLSALAYAIEGDHHDIVDYLIGHDANINLLDSSGRTLCHIIAQDRNIKLLRKVAQLGIDINRKDNNNGFTPLILASKNGWLDVVQVLVELGADTTKKCRNDHDALAYASMGNHSDIKCILTNQVPIIIPHLYVKRKSNLGPLFQRTNQLFFNACISGNLEKLNQEYTKGFSVNSYSKEGLTAMHYASYHGQKDVVKWLIDRGAIVNSFGMGHVTPLMVACACGHDGIVKTLTKHKCLLNCKADIQNRALHYAIRNTNILEHLLALDAVVDTVTYEGTSALSDACLTGNLKAAKLLVQYGADINKRDTLGRTPLTACARNGHVEVAQFLVEQGSDITVTCRDGKNALEYARENGKIDMCRLLKRMASEQGIEVCIEEDEASGVRSDGVMGNEAVMFGLRGRQGDDSDQSEASGAISNFLFGEDAARSEGRDTIRFSPSGMLQSDSNSHQSEASRAFSSFLRRQEAVRNDSDAISLSPTGMLQTDSDSDEESELNRYTRRFLTMCEDGEESDEFIQLLQDPNIDINGRNSAGQTGLILATKEEHPVVVRELLKHNADINCRDRNGRTALMHAVSVGNMPLVILLLEEGADMEILDNANNHVIAVATEAEHQEILMYLLSKKELTAQNEVRNAMFVDNCVFGELQEAAIALQNPSSISPESCQLSFLYAAVSFNQTLINIISENCKIVHYVMDIIKHCIQQNNKDAVEFILKRYILDISHLKPLVPHLDRDIYISMMRTLCERTFSNVCVKQFLRMLLMQSIDNAQYKLTFAAASTWLSLRMDGYMVNGT